VSARGPFSEDPSSGPPGLFEQSQRPEGSGPFGQAEPPRGGRSFWARYGTIVSMLVFIIVGTGLLELGARDDAAGTEPSSERAGAASDATGTVLVAHSEVVSGVYTARRSAISGAGRTTAFEFEIVGSGAGQHVERISGLRMRSARCDREPSSTKASFDFSNGQLGAGGSVVRGKHFRATFDGGYALHGVQVAGDRIRGTLSFLTDGCKGKIRFRAQRGPDGVARIANRVRAATGE
jgi:hypothetical protein